MLERIKQALCFLDLKKRMSGECEMPEITNQDAAYILTQIRILN